jgi:hypothetical protein
MSTKEKHEQLVDILKRWQKLENAAVLASAQVAEKTDHPLVHMLMGIILRDSQTHYAVQQMIIDSFEHEPIAIGPEDVAGVWDLVESHIETERRTVEMATEALGTLKEGRSVVARYLIEYLLDDEQKHNKLLDNLERIKGGLYPYGG